MALIVCEDCERDISSRAAACPHCGCPVRAEVADAGGPVAGAAEVNVSVVMPEGLSSAAASALRGATQSKTWGRLYESLRVLAIVWMVLCGIGAIYVLNGEQDQLGKLEPDSGLTQIASSYGFVESVSASEAQERLNAIGEYRLATSDDLTRKRRSIDNNSNEMVMMTIVSGILPLIALSGLHRWWRWLRQ